MSQESVLQARNGRKIRQAIFTLFVLFFCTQAAFSQTEVSGDVSGTWTEANSPYIVTDDIRVRSGRVLTIEPGVEVLFTHKDAGLEINGQLTAVGTKQDSIRFTHFHDDPDSTWDGIRFRYTRQQNLLSYVRIEYGHKRSTISGGGIYCLDSDLKINHSILANNYAWDSGGGLSTYGTCTVIINNTKFLDNTADRGGAFMSFHDPTIIIANSEIAFNTTLSTHFSYTLFAKSVVLYRTKIHNNTHGIYAGESLLLENCIMSNNNSGINAANTQNTKINNSILWNTGESIVPADMVSIRYTNIESGAQGAGNIDADPLFVDPDNGDFHLQPGSPCIDSGNPWAFNNDLDGTRNDMGVYGAFGFFVSPDVIDFGLTGKGQAKTQNIEFL